MDKFKLAAVGIVSTALIIALKQVKPELAVLAGAAAGIVILILLVNALSDIVTSFALIADKTGLNSGLFSGIIKIIGVGYITEFSANICDDAGNKSMGDKILMGGKVIIMTLSLPIVTSLIDIIIAMLP